MVTSSTWTPQGDPSRMFAGRHRVGVVLQLASALITGLGVAWCFYPMRDVLDVGGSCADGGPYVSAVPCPDGTWVMAIGIPLMTITVILATLVAVGSGTPLPVFPMWAALFGGLGWNFLEYGFGDPVSASWIVCGVVFELMALPALVLVLGALRNCPDDVPGQAGVRINWISIYLALGAVGWALGWWAYRSWL